MHNFIMPNWLMKQIICKNIASSTLVMLECLSIKVTVAILPLHFHFPYVHIAIMHAKNGNSCVIIRTIENACALSHT